MRQTFVAIGVFVIMFGQGLLSGFFGSMVYHHALGHEPLINALVWSLSAMLLVANILWYAIFIERVNE